MKRFVLISMVVLFVIFINSSCNQESNDIIMNEEQQKNINIYDNECELIKNLSSLNDSLICDVRSRGFISNVKRFFEFLDFVAVVAADIRGAVDGAKWGTSLGGWACAIPCAIITSATYSALAGIVKELDCDGGAITVVDAIDLELVEKAYASALLEENQCYVQSRSDEFYVSICIPDEYSEVSEVGILHNATLNNIKKYQKEDLKFGISDVLTQKQINVIHSVEFDSLYTNAISNPTFLSLEYMEENLTIEDRVVKLFLDAYKEYPADMDDVNYLINKYIELIEADSQISDEEKKVIYSALSTAAYSSIYWKEIENEILNR